MFFLFVQCIPGLGESNFLEGLIIIVELDINFDSFLQDAHTCMLDFDNSSTLFAVYDGHGGIKVYEELTFSGILSNVSFWVP